MSEESIEKIIRECFRQAQRDEKIGLKHKGLLIGKPDLKSALEYINKAKDSLSFCDLYRKMGADYKIPEEWFYTLYYCALAILSKFGVETRSQRYTALFIEYVSKRGVINYDIEFIKRIKVYSRKDETSEVDEREKARYSSSIKIEKVEERYVEMMNLCKNAISQCEEIVYSKKELFIPKELIDA